MEQKLKVLVGVSGGVDSAYTLSLLKADGYDVTAAFLIMNNSNSDSSSAKKTAAEVGADFVLIDKRKEFEETVISDFVNEYALGRTPNPCVVCNRLVKIKALVDYAATNGFDKVATGHYARICFNNQSGRFELFTAKDNKKDQSYMLWRLTQDMLSKLIFPLADIDKSNVRSSSSKAGLSSADKKDSLDICFVPDGNYAKLLESYGVGLESGTFVHADGRILGKSESITHYTVGQRRGLGLAMDRSVFVTKLDSENNVVTVDYEEGIYKKTFTADRLNFVSAASEEALKNERVFVKIRYAAKPAECSVDFSDGVCSVTAKDRFRAVTPGQSAVFYDSDGRLLFGGYIR